MEVVVISDTHGYHSQLTLPAGDMLIHAGDVSGRGLKTQVTDFLEWFAAQPHADKILIAGNHDFFFEKISDEELQNIMPPNVIYLKDSATTVKGVKLWGSPATTWYYDWAFNSRTEAELEQLWATIPTDTDIIITHGPPLGIMDKTHGGIHTGCKHLLHRIETIKPKLSVFGHIHEGYGKHVSEHTTFINGCSLSANYQSLNQPITVQLK
jgi:Icc-related predicted phosphoesterase